MDNQPASGAPGAQRTDKVVLTVHGINTYGDWAAKLARILQHHDPRIETESYSYGYFSILAFLIPFLRWIEVLRCRRELYCLKRRTDGRTVDIVAHSFGTFIVAKAIRSARPERLPRIGTVILAGSVLRSSFDWSSLLHSGKLERVVNECGVDDDVLIASQFLVLFTGMAGRIGFFGALGTVLTNRWHRGDHGLYFEGDFMCKHWLPLLTTRGPVPAIDERPRLQGLRPIQIWLLQNLDVPKLLLYAALPLWLVAWQFDQREIAYATQVAVRANALIAPGRPTTVDGLRLAIESVSTRPTDIGTRTLERALDLLPTRRSQLALPAGLQSLHFDRAGRRGLAVLADRVAVFDVATGAIVGGVDVDNLGFAVLSPQGDRVLVVDHLRTVALWEPGAERPRGQRLLEGYPKTARFTADGQRGLVLTTANGRELASVEELDSATGRHLRTVPVEPGTVSAAAFSHDGRWVATATDDGDTQTGEPRAGPSYLVRVWDASTGDVVRTYRTESGVTALAFGLRDTYLAAGFDNGVTRVWSTVQGGSEPILESRRARPVSELAFSDALPEVDLPQSMTVREIVSDTTADRALAQGLAMQPRALLAVRTDDSSVAVIDLLARQEVGLIVAQAAVVSVAFAPRSGSLLLTGGEQTQSWNPATMAASTMRTTSPVVALALGPQEQSVMALGDDGIWRAWHRETGRQLTQITLIAPRAPPPLLKAARLAVGAHGIVVFGTSEGQGELRLRAWDGLSGWPVLADEAHAPVELLASSSDGRRLVSALQDGTVQVWAVDPPHGVARRALGSVPSALGVSHDGEWVAAGEAAGRLHLWRVRANTHRSFDTQGRVVAVAFGAGQGLVAYADERGNTTVRHVESGDTVFETRTPAAPYALSFGAAGQLALAADTLRIVDVRAGRVVAEREYDGEIRDMVMAPAQQRLYYAIGNAVHVWAWDWAANLREACKRVPLPLTASERLALGIEARKNKPCAGA